MILTMLVTLYTSRIVLNTLGVEDFGIYNVVGGFVTMFGFLNSAMSSATQRFLAFEIGKKDRIQIGNVFSMSINIHLLIALIVLVLAETIGLWFVNNQLTIPSDRLTAANWVFQFSILSLIVSMLSVPYNAIIIAYERMGVFAWVSIIEVALKLILVLMLQFLGFDKLVLYSILMFGVSILIRLIYGIYCNRNFQESKYRFYWDKPLFKTLMSFAGWNLWGSTAGVFYGQGINVLLNIFFGPTVNAARGIAYQIKGAVFRFVQSFQTAMNPQIIKSYATNDSIYMNQLIMQGSKYSYFLLYAMSLPILLETAIILKLWLKIVPEYTVIFSQLVIVNILIDSVSGPLMTAAQATGKIKLYQGVIGGLLILILPFSYLFLRLGYPPEVTLYVSILMSILALFARLIIIHHLIGLSVMDFTINVIVKVLFVSVIAFIIPFIIKNMFSQSILRLILLSFASTISVLASIFFIGLSSSERLFVKAKAKKIINR